MQHEYCVHEERDVVTGLQLFIRQDECAENPREGWDHMSTMSCWHRRYRLGDRHDWPDPDAFEADMKGIPHLRLPLYLYDHSGITISTTPFSCPWDSGQVGWIHMSRSLIREEYAVRRLIKPIRETALALMRAEVVEYDQFLRGDIWNIDIEEADGELLESCGEYYGESEAVAEGRALFADLVADRRSEIATSQAAQMSAARPDMYGQL